MNTHSVVKKKVQNRTRNYGVSDRKEFYLLNGGPFFGHAIRKFHYEIIFRKWNVTKKGVFEYIVISCIIQSIDKFNI